MNITELVENLEPIKGTIQGFKRYCDFCNQKNIKQEEGTIHSDIFFDAQIYKIDEGFMLSLTCVGCNQEKLSLFGYCRNENAYRVVLKPAEDFLEDF